MIRFEDLLVKHYILFDYDTSGFYSFDRPHHIFKISDSIHYKSLVNNDFSDYVNLITTTDQKEHSLDNFKKLIKEFDINQIKDNKIKICWDERLSKYIVEDGCHRLSLIMFNKLDENGEMSREWFDIKKSNEYE